MVYSFPSIFERWKENHPLQNPTFFTPCLPCHVIRLYSSVRFSLRNFLSPNYKQICRVRDWNSKISQSIQNLGFLKNRCFFSKKNDFFFKISKAGEFAVEYVSIDNISWKSLLHLNSEISLAKNQEMFKFGEIRKQDGERTFWKRNILKGMLNKMGVIEKNAAGGWPSCKIQRNLTWYIFHGFTIGCFFLWLST